jgi:hypothetical protein
MKNNKTTFRPVWPMFHCASSTTGRFFVMKTIPLTKGFVAMVDDEDYEWLSKYNWCVRPSWNTHYACRRKQRGPDNPRRVGNIDMHTQITGYERCDHKDRNGLNNQRSNLRPADYRQNNGNMGLHRDNTSGFKGVHRMGKKWRATIGINGVSVPIGSFYDKREAAEAYDRAAISHFGEEFALTNRKMGLL